MCQDVCLKTELFSDQTEIFSDLGLQEEGLEAPGGQQGGQGGHTEGEGRHGGHGGRHHRAPHHRGDGGAARNHQTLVESLLQAQASRWVRGQVWKYFIFEIFSLQMSSEDRRLQ